MTKTDYPIYTDDGKLFCKKITGEDGTQILEGPKGMRITIENLNKQYYSPSVANKKRGKIQQRGR